MREHETTDWSLDQLRKDIPKELQVLKAGVDTIKLNQLNQPFYMHPSSSILLTNTKYSKGRFIKQPTLPNQDRVVFAKAPSSQVIAEW